MKIQFASDLHLEFLAKRFPGERLVVLAPEADVLVLAGDIDNGTSALQHFASWPIPVLYVAGNHEFYDTQITEKRTQLREKSKECGIHFLDNDALEIDNVRFLGSTMWTDYQLPTLDRPQKVLMREAETRLNDHKLIGKDRKHNFRPEDALQSHKLARAWLTAELNKPWREDGKTVVITHHGCHPSSIHDRYKEDLLSAAFASDLTELMKLADGWIHGHIHHSLDHAVEGCRVVANPAGYIRNRQWAKSAAEFEFENPVWNPQLVIEV